MNQEGQLNTARGNWIKLRAGDAEFIVPQHDVVKTGYLQTQLTSDNDLKGVLCAVEDATQTTHALLTSHEVSDTPDTLALQDKAYYVALSPQLELMTSCPEQRYLLTTFIGSDWQWCWDEVNVLLDMPLEVEPLPARLATSYTPVLGVMMMDDKPVFYTNAERIFKYVLWQVQR